MTWTVLQPSIRCRVWKTHPGDATRTYDRKTLLLFWRIDSDGRLRYLDAHGEDLNATLCFEFEFER